MGSENNSHQGREKDEEKKTTELSIRGGAGCEIGGLVALGGAVAAAALIAALTNKAKKKRPTTSVKDPPKPTGLPKKLKNSSHCSCVEGGNEGLRSLLRTPSQSVQCHQHSSCCFFCDEGLSRIGSTHIKFSKLVVVQSLILETNINSSKETDENASAFEFDDYNINKAGTPVSTMEALPLLNVGDSGSPVVDERPSVKRKGGGEDDEFFEQQEEEEEKGSEGTPDSSLESSTEAVWPEESIETEMLGFKETKAYCLYSADKNDKGTNKEDEITVSKMEILDPKEDDMEFNMVNHATLSASSRSRRFLL